MKFNHVTIHVPAGVIRQRGVEDFFNMLAFDEIPANDPYEHGWNVRWFCPRLAPGIEPNIHLIETDDGEEDQPALGHICIETGRQEVVDRIEKRARQRKWLERASGSGRIWVRFANIRVEVRP